MQPTPKVTREDVERIIHRDFSADKYAEVAAILEEYGKSERYRERERVQLAALKLADRQIDLLREEIKLAKIDYRDVLSSAEYPEYSKSWDTYKLPQEQRDQIIARDWKQYEDWINAK